MTKAQSDYKKWRWVTESPYGAGAAGVKQTNIRGTMDNMRQREEKVESDEITGTRGIKEMFRNRIWTEGQFESMLFYSEFQTWMLYVLGASAWSASVSVTTEACHLLNSTITKAATVWTNDPTPGQWIWITGSVNPTSNGWTKVISTTTTVITVSKSFINENNIILTIVEPPMAVDGTTVGSFGLEREISDVGSDFTEFRGSVMAGMEMRILREGIIRVTWNILGATENTDTTTFGDGSPTAAGSEEAFRTGANLDFVQENLIGISAKNLTLNIQSGAHADYKLGSDGPDTYLLNKVRVLGTHEACYESKALYDKYLLHTLTSFAVSLVDPDTNRLLIEVINADLGEGERTGGGLETDTLITAPFQGVEDPTELKTVRITKLDAA